MDTCEALNSERSNLWVFPPKADIKTNKGTCNCLMKKQSL